MNPLIIGLSGKKGSGKSTVADIIQDLCSEMNPVKLAFADPLKEEVATACGVSVAYLEAHKNNFRLILQGWGTDFRRHLQTDNYWIAKSLDKIGKLPETNKLVIMTDVRFKNEFDMIKHLGGKVWRVEHWFTRDMTDTHPSECELDDANFDAVIHNKFGLYELELIVKTRLQTEGLLA